MPCVCKECTKQHMPHSGAQKPVVSKTGRMQHLQMSCVRHATFRVWQQLFRSTVLRLLTCAFLAEAFRLITGSDGAALLSTSCCRPSPVGQEAVGRQLAFRHHMQE